MASTVTRFDYHCLNLPLAGVRDPVDIAMALPSRIGLLAAIVDPIGQGQKALMVSRRAAQTLSRTPGAELGDLFSRTHRALADLGGGGGGVGGASFGAARIDPAGGRVEFASVGRVYGAVVGPRGLKLLSPEAGAVGIGLPKAPATTTVDWTPGDLLILAVDGLVDAWDLTKIRGMFQDSFEAIAQRVGGYSARLPEDASLVLARERG